MDEPVSPIQLNHIKEDQASLFQVLVSRLNRKPLENPLELSQVLTQPNATTLEDMLKEINQDNPNPGVGHLVKPGQLGIVERNGKIQAVGPGRYLFPHPREELKRVANLSDITIVVETLSIIRVERGKIGIATENGQPVLLAEGTHVKNTRLFAHVRFSELNVEYLSHESIHIIRIPKGSYGLATDHGIPKLLTPGVHCTNSNVFTFKGLKKINQQYITHGTIHLLQVPYGQVALVVDNNKPSLLQQGTHFINSNTFNFDRMEDLNQRVITHKTITRFRVLKGELGLAWDNNQPEFFTEGIYERDSINFSFVNCVDASDQFISLGSKKIISVWDGEVGVTFNKGKLIVLKPDKHLIESVDHVFKGFLSTQQQCLHLAHTDGGGAIDKAKDPSLLHCETKDFVSIGLKADVFYKIVSPEKVLLIVGQDSITPLIRETSIATVTSIMRNTSLAEVAQNKNPRYTSETEHLDNLSSHPGQPSAPLFFDKVHDEFISKLHDDFVNKYGIEITNIRIESFKISDKELADNISKQVMVTAQTENQLANLAGQTEIATAQMRRDAEVAKIKAEGDSIRIRTDTESKNKATRDMAKADADAAVIKARAEAEAVELKAAAEAKAILLRADAESRRAEMLQKQQLGGELAKFELYSNMVQKSMGGVNKVMYFPTDSTNNPLNFFNMQGGQLPGFGKTKN